METRRGEILFFFGVAVALGVAYLLRDVLLLIYVSALFAVVINPAIEQVRRARVRSWHPSRGLAIILIIIAVLVAFGAFSIFALPPIYRDWTRRRCSSI